MIHKNNSIRYIVNKTNKMISHDAGFHVDESIVISGVNYANEELAKIPTTVFNAIDFKSLSSIVGALFCKGIENYTNCIVNPIEKGHPDILPTNAKTASRAELMNYPNGLEVKCTCGNLKNSIIHEYGVRRINDLGGITWQAHHPEVGKLMAIVWDFNSFDNESPTPIITGVFYANTLLPSDWGTVSGTTGRNTKVTALLKTGKIKLGTGWIAIKDEKIYINRYSKILGFSI